MVRRSQFLHMTMYLILVAAMPPAHAADRSPPLQPTTIKDWQAAGMDGTGCYWSARRNGPILFAASGRIGVTKVAGRVVLLAPAPSSRELFPFTHDAWTAVGLTIRVVDSGSVRATGEEAVTTDATLIVMAGGKERTMRGAMICGS